MTADFETVEDQSLAISNFRLQDGAVMPQAKIVYETYGRLAADGKNAALITHGYTSSHHCNPAVKDFAKIEATVLYVLCRTDKLFPPSIAPGVMGALAAAGVDAGYFEIDSDLGHSASGPEQAKWSPVLREFLGPLMAKLG